MLEAVALCVGSITFVSVAVGCCDGSSNSRVYVQATVFFCICSSRLHFGSSIFLCW